MPANAEFIYKLIFKIATLNIVPTDEVTDKIETAFGITNDDFALTDSFVGFEFDSSGPISNL